MISSSRCTHLLLLLPLMFSFFVMGFVDLVGIASNYAKADYQLTDTTANFLPSLVFFWFLLFSVPTSILMNKIGRKRTLLLSLCVTMAALLLPVFNKSFAGMLAAFSLLGIGNTLMQTSVTPLLSTVVSDDELSSALTFGQFVKAIASFLAPLIAAWGGTLQCVRHELAHTVRGIHAHCRVGRNGAERHPFQRRKACRHFGATKHLCAHAPAHGVRLLHRHSVSCGH